MLRVAAQDLRFGLRMSLKNPGFTLVAVLTLAVGIAASTTVFSWIDSVLVRPIPGVTNGHELLSFESQAPNGEFMGSSYPDYQDHRDHLKLLAGLAVTKPDPLSIGEEDHAERVWGELVSGNYFAVLGVKPAAGRFFSPEEYGDKQGGYPVAVISYSLWKRRFSADPGVIGATIRVNRQKLTIIGVAPPEFRGTLPGLAFETWIPLMMAPQLNTMPDWMLRDRHTRNLLGLARPKPGVTLQQANAEVAALAGQLASAHADTSAGVGAALLPVWKAHSGAQSMLLAPLQILMAVCGVVLLIVCANVANLLLARITARHKEFSVRLALGAGRGRLVMQLLAESLILAVMGGLVGAPLALWMAQALGALVPPAGFPIALDIEMNADIFAFTMLLCVVACVLSGIAPALHTARADLSDALKQGGRSGSAGKHSKQLRGLLVVSEVALALVAIIGAGLFARSFQLARHHLPQTLRTIAESTHASVYPVAATRQRCDMYSANDSLSQRSSHHFIVTRSPNHMCDISWRTCWHRVSISSAGGRPAVEVLVAEGDAAGVLHRAGVELRHEDLVVLPERVADAEQPVEVVEATAASLEDLGGVPLERFSQRGPRVEAQRDAVVLVAHGDVGAGADGHEVRRERPRRRQRPLPPAPSAPGAVAEHDPVDRARGPSRRRAP